MEAAAGVVVVAVQTQRIACNFLDLSAVVERKRRKSQIGFLCCSHCGSVCGLKAGE